MDYGAGDDVSPEMGGIAIIIIVKSVKRNIAGTTSCARFSLVRLKNAANVVRAVRANRLVPFMAGPSLKLEPRCQPNASCLGWDCDATQLTGFEKRQTVSIYFRSSRAVASARLIGLVL